MSVPAGGRLAVGAASSITLPLRHLAALRAFPTRR
jgi:hypothetical protein